HLIGQPIAPVEHRQHDADDPELGVEALLNLLDRLQELAQPFERKELALQRHHQRVVRRQRVQRQQTQRRWAINETDVVAAVTAQPIPQPGGAPFHADQFDFRSAKINSGRDKIQPGDGCRNNALIERRLIDQQVIAGEIALRGTNAQSSRRVSLRIEVDEKRFPPRRRHGRRDIDGRGGLSHPAFLIGYRDPDHDKSGTPLPTSMPPPSSVCECSTWNICWIESGCSDSSCAAERPLGNSHTVACVENRADKFSSLPSGAKARAVITPAEKLSTLSRRAPTTEQLGSANSSIARRSHSTRRLRDSTSTMVRSG